MIGVIYPPRRYTLKRSGCHRAGFIDKHAAGTQLQQQQQADRKQQPADVQRRADVQRQHLTDGSVSRRLLFVICCQKQG